MTQAYHDIFWDLAAYHMPSDYSGGDKGCEEAWARAQLTAKEMLAALAAEYRCANCISQRYTLGSEESGIP